MTTNSDEIQRRLHEALAETEVIPAQILPDHAKHLRPSSLSETSEYSISSRRSSVKQETSSPLIDFLRKNLLYIVLVIIVLIVGFFVYKKWKVIKNLGVGYGIASVPGLKSVGSRVAGVKSEQIDEELDALESGTHPGVQRDKRVSVKSEVSIESASTESEEEEDDVVVVRQTKISKLIKSAVELKEEEEEEDGDDEASAAESSDDFEVE